MDFITGNFKKEIIENPESIKDLIVLDGKTIEGTYLTIESILLKNKNVQTIKSESSDNVLIFISSTEDKSIFEKNVSSLIESNISINNYLYPSEFIEECTEEIWFYPNLDLVVLKYDHDVLMKIVDLGEK